VNEPVWSTKWKGSFPTSAAPVNEGIRCGVYHLKEPADFINWIRSDAFVKGHAQSATLPRDAYYKSNVLELHEVLQDSSRLSCA